MFKVFYFERPHLEKLSCVSDDLDPETSEKIQQLVFTHESVSPAEEQRKEWRDTHTQEVCQGEVGGALFLVTSSCLGVASQHV